MIRFPLSDNAARAALGYLLLAGEIIVAVAGVALIWAILVIFGG